MSSQSFDLQKGKMLGRNYRVLEFLGKGWEGEVYKVEERVTGIVRAAKLFYKHRYTSRLNPHVVYAKKLYRLRSCPVVIQYHNQDSAVIDEVPTDFLISEFVDGEVLADFIERQPKKKLALFEALHLFYCLVQGVEHIHFLGDYHGDIHTENIIVKRKGLNFEVKLIDLMHLGKPTRSKIQEDVYDLMDVFFDMIGGVKHYKNTHPNIKQMILGRKRTLIAKKFKEAGHLRLCMENMAWES